MYTGVSFLAILLYGNRKIPRNIQAENREQCKIFIGENQPAETVKGTLRINIHRESNTIMIGVK